MLRGLGDHAAVLLPAPRYQRQQRRRAPAEEPLQRPPQNRSVWPPAGPGRGAGHLRQRLPFLAGRISVPLDLQRLDQFDPFAVPTIRWASRGGPQGGPGSAGSPCHVPLSPAAPCATSWTRPAMTGSRRTAERRSRSGACGVSGAASGARGVSTPPVGFSRSAPSAPADYKRTSLAPYVRVFEQFLEEMERARRGEQLRRSGKRREEKQPAWGPGGAPWLWGAALFL